MDLVWPNFEVFSRKNIFGPFSSQLLAELYQEVYLSYAIFGSYDLISGLFGPILATFWNFWYFLTIFS